MSEENGHPRDDWFSRFGWAVVLTATLSMSAYSLYFVGTHLGMPWYFAAIVSMCFDGVAVLAADYSLRYARMGLTATGPQLTVFLFGGLSAYLNTLHVFYAHEIPIAKLLWAAPPVASILVFEFHTKWERLSALRSAGRVAESLPLLGRPSWIHHPIASLRAIRTISGERLTEIIAQEAPQAFQAERGRIDGEARAEQERSAVETAAHHARTSSEALARQERDNAVSAERQLQGALATAPTQAERVRIALVHLGDTEASHVCSWLEAKGYGGVSPAYVRSTRSRQARKAVTGPLAAVRQLPVAVNDQVNDG